MGVRTQKRGSSYLGAGCGLWGLGTWLGEVWGAEWADLRGQRGHWRGLVVSWGWSEGEGHLRKAVVKEGGSWLLANKPWIPSPSSPKHTSCLLSFYAVVGNRGGPPLEMRLFEEDWLPCYLFGVDGSALSPHAPCPIPHLTPSELTEGEI